ncbi:tyrosine aminotransferase-like [Limulus polyphemus]|uniref:Tyrosine aminotransferase n=1 Tax=Limulus polyphemus TaxID=6850 RepID=A0ABM1SLS4_LIMPO|nr:tyrosine aminotransferase-like [Limulus polyphemus]
MPSKVVYISSQIHDSDDELPNFVTRRSWNVMPSKLAVNTVNPIRKIVENMKITPNPKKYMIALSIGDPTVFGNLKPCEKITEAIVDSVRSKKFNGYGTSVGLEEAREAVAVYTSCPGASIEAKDVILNSGCSHALEMCMTVLANPGQNILAPRPGFPLYRTLAESTGIEVKYYELLSYDVIFHAMWMFHNIALSWDVFISLFVVPNMKCDSREKKQVYACSGRAFLGLKQSNNLILQIRKGLQSLSQKIMGPCTLVQGALPTILKETSQQFYNGTIECVRRNAEKSYTILSKVPGLNPIMPAGAMYMMVGIDMDRFGEFKSDLEFVERMVSEQSVFCLPGTCFNYPDFIRIVLTVPEEQMQEACERIADFCNHHYECY